MMKKQDSYKPILILLAILFLLLVVFPGPIQAYTLVWEVTSGSGVIYAITADDDYIYVTGSNYRVEKYRKSDGNLEWKYPGSDGTARGIAQDDDYVYVSGIETVSSGGGNTNFGIRVQKHRKSDGGLEWTYSYDPCNDADSVDNSRAITADAGASGYIYIGGTDATPPGHENMQWHITKRRKDNSATGGWVAIGLFSVGWDEVRSMASDNDYIYVGGHDNVNGLNTERARLEKRRKSNGSVVEWVQRYTRKSVYGIASDDDDNGYIYTAMVDGWNVKKHRKSDGVAEWEKSYSFPGSGERSEAICIDDDYVYLAGDDDIPGNNEWRIQKHRISDGELVWEHTVNHSNSDEEAYAIIADSDPEGFIYIAGSDKMTGSSRWRIEKRKKVGHVDIGLRVYDQDLTEPIKIAAEPQGTLTSPLRIAKNGVVWGIVLIDSTDPKFGDPQYDSGVRIRTGSGDIKALRKL